MSRYKLVIFDLDGTLLDTVEDLTDSVNFALSRFGYQTRTIAEVRSFVGNGIRNLIERAVPSGTAEGDVDLVFSAFHNHYREHSSDKTKPYHGVCRLIERLKERGILLAVVSNKAHEAVELLCDKYFGDSFSVVIGEQKGFARKPSPQSVNTVMKKLGISPSQALYVGDSEVDILTAQNAGIDLCLVTWGFRDRDFLSSFGVGVFADCMDELEAVAVS